MPLFSNIEILEATYIPVLGRSAAVGVCDVCHPLTFNPLLRRCVDAGSKELSGWEVGQFNSRKRNETTSEESLILCIRCVIRHLHTIHSIMIYRVTSTVFAHMCCYNGNDSNINLSSSNVNKDLKFQQKSGSSANNWRWIKACFAYLLQ